MKVDSTWSIGDRVAYVRGKDTIGAYAKKLSVHRNTLTNYEKDDRKPDADALLALFELGINPTWILTGEGSIFAPGHDVTISSDLRNKIVHDQLEPLPEETTTYTMSEQQDDSRNMVPTLVEKVGSAEDHTEMTTAELSNLGSKWWDVIRSLSSTQQNAVLTLVFDHVIAQFIQMNGDRFDDSTESAQIGLKRLSTYLNNNGPFSVERKHK